MKYPGSLLLRIISLLVPRQSRHDWTREWDAELENLWNPGSGHHPPTVVFYIRILGSAEDALWLRTNQRNDSMLLQNIKYAFRGLRRNPGFTFVVLLTLALGIGANSAVFALVDAVLLRSLPVNEPAELVDVYTSCRRGYQWCSTSYPDYMDYRDRNHTLDDLAAYAGLMVGLSNGESSAMTEAMLVTGNYFGVLGIGAAKGRLLNVNDNNLARPNPAVVLRHSVWQGRYGADPDIVGSDIVLNGMSFTIIGVAPEGFSGTRLNMSPEMWIPMATIAMFDGQAGGDRVARLEERRYRWMDALIGRRASGVGLEEVRADMAVVSRQLEDESPATSDGGTRRSGRQITVEGTRAATLPMSSGGDLTRFVWLLMGVVLSALLIACANIANLLLSRANARRHEMGVRLALGASRGRLISQLLTESFVLSLTGAVLSIGVAKGILAVLSGYSLPGFVSIASIDVSLDHRVLLFTLGVTTVTALLFGLVPALQSTSTDIADSIKGGSTGQGPTAMKTRNVLLGFQSGIAVILLVAAGLFVKSLQNGLDTDVGYRTSNIAMGAVNFEPRGYTEGQANQFLDDWAALVSATTGATSVTTAVREPMSRSSSGYMANFLDYQPTEGEEVRIEANFVGPRFFETMGIGLRVGRDFLISDAPGAPMVAVVNQTIVDKYFRGENPVGKTFSINAGADFTIVGTVPDVNHALREEQGPFIYFPVKQQIDQALRRSIYLLAATPADAANSLSAIRSAVISLDPGLPISELTTMTNRKAEHLMPQRMGATLLSALGGLTTLLTVVGIWGVVGYMIARRKREIGIRLALGAERSVIVRMIATGASKPILIGIGVGIVGSVVLSKLITAFLYDIAPTDLPTYLVITVALTCVTLIAAYLPAKKIAQIDPTESLRAE